MAVTVEQLQDYIGTKETGTFIETCLTDGELLVKNYIGTCGVPSTVQDLAVLTCASELFHRRQAPNGIAQFAATDGAPIRVAKDPMNSVYPILLPFLGVGL